jgi:hypothetical protein
MDYAEGTFVFGLANGFVFRRRLAQQNKEAEVIFQRELNFGLVRPALSGDKAHSLDEDFAPGHQGLKRLFN